MIFERNGPPDGVDIWVLGWARVLNYLDRMWDTALLEGNQVELLLRESPVREQICAQAGSYSWVGLYEMPARRAFPAAFLRMFGISGGSQIVGEVVREALALVRGFEANGFEESHELSTLGIGRVYLGLHVWRCQLQSVLAFGVTVSELLRRARDERDDQALLKALRVDSAVLATPTATARIRRASGSGDEEFVQSLLSAAENRVDPVRERQNARLDVALLLLLQARQLRNLTPRRATLLFIEQTRLYPTHGRVDPERSLWRHIQRWKKKHATELR